MHRFFNNVNGYHCDKFWLNTRLLLGFIALFSQAETVGMSGSTERCSLLCAVYV